MYGHQYVRVGWGLRCITVPLTMGLTGASFRSKLEFVAIDFKNQAGTTFNPILPAGVQNGDLLVFIGCNAGSTATFTISGTGWTERLDSTARYTASGIYTGELPTFTASGDNGNSFFTLAFRRASFGAISTTSATEANPIAPSFTVPATNSFLIGAVAQPSGGNTYSAPEGWTKLGEVSTPTQVSVFIKNSLQTSGSSGTTTFTRATGTSALPRAWQMSISPTV